MAPNGTSRRELDGLAGAQLSPNDRRQLTDHPVSLGRIAALFQPHRLRLALVSLLIMAVSALGVATPFLTQRAIDEALPQRNFTLLAALVGAWVAVIVITNLLGVVQTWMSTRIGQQVMHRLRTDVFSHLQRQSLSFFTRTRGGEVQSRLTHDIGGMQSVVTNAATSIASNVTGAIGTAIAMAALSWQLSLFSLVVLPPAIWITRRVARMRREVTAKQQQALADLHGHVEESLSVSGVQLSKTLGATGAASAEFEAQSGELLKLEINSQLAGRWRMATLAILFGVLPALLYLAAGMPWGQHLSVGTVVAFVALQSALFRPLLGVLSVGVQVSSSLALFSRVFEYLDLPVEIADPAEPVTLDPATARGEVRFDNVSFRYADGQSDALHEVNLVVPARTSLAVVGATGSGKSTLVSLIDRLADPTAGAVSIDGVDLRDLTLDNVASLVGIVTQETYLLHTTVRENLRHARPQATDAQLEAAARAAQIHDTITALPQGYETVVGSRGYRFSGGERQRLAIARTILRDPAVLVFDEATSALDNATERSLQEALNALSAGRTTITIAHRLSTIVNADQIAVLDHGEVVELGTHTQLLAQHGRYAELAQRPEGEVLSLATNA